MLKLRCSAVRDDKHVQPLTKFQPKVLTRLHRIFDRARSGCERSASFKSLNMQKNIVTRYDRMAVKNSLA